MQGSKTNKHPNRGGNSKAQGSGPPTDTAEKNYTAQCIGQTEKGGVYLGGISKDGSTTNAIKLENKLKDSYGCGDSFAAGVTAALAAGWGYNEAIKIGAKCGANCATHFGPYPKSQ